jgi:hypothetical protein
MDDISICMDRIAKNILNSLQCPICKAPIDMVCHGALRGYNYCCASNQDHYAIGLDFGEIKKEIVNIYDSNHKYSIIKLYNDSGQIETIINIFETDLENRVIFSFKEKKIAFDNDIFDFKNFKANKALNRIKTIFVFQ